MWRARTSSRSGAAQWIRSRIPQRDAPAPQVGQQSFAEELANEAANQLAERWSGIAEALADIDQEANFDWFLPHGPSHLPPTTGHDGMDNGSEAPDK